MSAKKMKKILTVLLLVILGFGLIAIFFFWAILQNAKNTLEVMTLSQSDDSDKGIYEVFGTLYLDEVVSTGGISYDAEVVVDNYRALSDSLIRSEISQRKYEMLGWEVFDADENLVERLNAKKIRLIGIIFSPCGDASYLRPPTTDKAQPCLFFSSKGYIYLLGKNREPFMIYESAKRGEN